MKTSLIRSVLAVLLISATAHAQCPGDVNDNGQVNAVDLAAVLGAWGTNGQGEGGSDVNADGTVSAEDLAVVLAAWGPCTPVVLSVSPSSGTVAGGTRITVSGRYFTGATAVHLNNMPVADLKVESDTQLHGTTPPSSAGAAVISVSVGGRTGSRAGAFTFANSSISSVLPTAGSFQGGTPVSITGAFLKNTISVSFGTHLAQSFVQVSSSEVVAISPPGEVGTTVDVVVETPAGAVVADGAFTYVEVVVPTWATLLEAYPDPTVVTDPVLLDAIVATGFAWRVYDTATQIEMVLIPPGTFMMGCSASSQPACFSNENPAHEVTLTQPFYLGRYEVTQAQWTAVMGVNPSCFLGSPDSPSRPVENISWNNAQAFMSQTGLRLPTEAEWEYAYRAGTATGFHGFAGRPGGFDDESELGSIAWFSGNSGGRTHPVGLLAGNGFGLHDMPGNAWEYVADWFDPAYYEQSPTVDPRGPESGSMRGVRGGDWWNPQSICRASYRDDSGPNDGFCGNGFRVARTAQLPPSLQSVSPASGLVSGGTRVVLSGSRLTNTLWVMFGDQLASNLEIDGDSSVSVNAPSGPLGLVDVTLATEGGSVEFQDAFDYFALAPQLHSIEPSVGSVSGGSRVTMRGEFLSGVTSVVVGGRPATGVIEVDHSTLLAITPTGLLGPQDVSIHTPMGESSLKGAFTYVEVVVPTWATLLEAYPDPTVVTDPVLLDAIVATGFAWRVYDTATQIEMVLIPPGTFMMGCSPSSQFACISDENPVHTVTLTSAFYMGRYEVTQAQWTARMGSNPSNFQSASAVVPASQVPNRPVERVSWNTIQGFLSATGMRLPTEAEWEYAYRAGTSTAFHSMPGYPNGTNDDSLVGTIAWISGNSASQTRPVGQLAGNGFGLHDMAGNVDEWISDRYSATYYATSPAIDPLGPASGSSRGLRGGDWGYGATWCRSSSRFGFPATSSATWSGFRVARNP